MAASIDIAFSLATTASTSSGPLSSAGSAPASAVNESTDALLPARAGQSGQERRVASSPRTEPSISVFGLLDFMGPDGRESPAELSQASFAPASPVWPVIYCTFASPTRTSVRTIAICLLTCKRSDRAERLSSRRQIFGSVRGTTELSVVPGRAVMGKGAL